MGWVCWAVHKAPERTNSMKYRCSVWPVTGMLASLTYGCNGCWQWQWWWWAARGRHHRNCRVMTRLILWLRISPRLLCLIPTTTYTGYRLRVRNSCSDIWYSQMPVLTTVLLWMFLLSVLFSLLVWILALYKWHRHGFLPPAEICQVEVEFPCALVPPNGYHTVVIGSSTYGFIQLRKLNSFLIVFLPTLVWIYSAQGVCT